MDKQDADRALDQALTDLEQSRSGADREQMAALLAAVVLIGRRLVPARTSADDATMPGKVQRMAERRQSAGVPYPGPATPRVDPPRKERRWVDEQGRARRDMVPADEPTPALRALFTGESIAKEVPEPVGAFAWTDDGAVSAPGPMGPRAAEVWDVEDQREQAQRDPLAAKDRAELAATLTQLESERRKTAAMQRVIDDARSALALTLGDGADATLTYLVNNARARIASEKERARLAACNSEAWMHSFSRVADVLDCPAGEPSVLAAISTLKMERNHARLHAAALYNSLRDALGLPGNALDSVIVAKVREMGEVLREAHKTITAGREKLATVLGDGAAMLPELVDRAVTHIEVLRSEHARERTTVDELRGMQAEMVEATEAAKDEANEHRARWDRIQSLIAAVRDLAAKRAGTADVVEAWERWNSDGASGEVRSPSPGPITRDEAIEIARRAAAGPHRPGYYKEPFTPHEWVIDAILMIDATLGVHDGPADVPHQPDDPGVTAESGGGLTGVESDR
jgi:hypothetical protein